ncbi:MAG: hypothetical protein P1U34_04290 [Coxiellaceae bacterium]|nr:hypothetical protein [Coxiellaceae bacterium]
MSRQQQQNQVAQIIEQMQSLRAELTSPDRIIPKGSRAGDYLAKFEASLADVVQMLAQLKAGETVLVADFNALMTVARLNVIQGVDELNKGYDAQFPSLVDRYPGLGRKLDEMAVMSEQMFGGGGRRNKRKPQAAPVRVSRASPTVASPLITRRLPKAAPKESCCCCFSLSLFFKRRTKAAATSGRAYAGVHTERPGQ